MTIIKNFERFVNENLEQKFQVFEDEINLGVSGRGYQANELVREEYSKWLTTPAAAQFRAFIALQEVSGNPLANDSNQADIIYSLLKRGQATKKGFLGIGKTTETDIVKAGFEALKTDKLKLNVVQGVAEYVPRSAAETWKVRIAGSFPSSSYLIREPKYNQYVTDAYKMIAFVNEFNTEAFRNGTGQYVLSKRLREDGYLDFLSEADVVDQNTLYLYASKIKGQVAASKDVVETPVGGEPEATGKYGAEFAVGSAEINPAVQAEVDKAAEFVAAKFPAGSVPDKFQLTSGASTEWNKKNYPQTSGTGAVANPATDEQKNQDLAYRRGVAFANALNAKLKEKGHPGIDGYVVNWAIGRSGQQANQADRFIDLEVKKNEVAPKKQASISVSQTGSTATQVTTAKGQIFEYQLSITAAAAPAAPAAPAQ